MVKKISLEEAKRLRLDILKEIDRFCKEHKIVYFLTFGTLLGAIRHKGFIPWDDDCDIMMPRPELDRFIKDFCNNTHFEIITNKSGRGQIWGFVRVANKNTYNERFGWKYPGINVEIYPIDGAPSSKTVSLFFILGVYLFKFIERVIAKLSFLLMKWRMWPFKKPECVISRVFIRMFHFYGSLFRYEYSKKAALIFGNPYRKMIFDKSLFLNSTKVSFEHAEFDAPMDSSFFLTEIYGDYMTPPPENQRRIHGGNYCFVTEDDTI